MAPSISLIFKEKAIAERLNTCVNILSGWNGPKMEDLKVSVDVCSECCAQFFLFYAAHEGKSYCEKCNFSNVNTIVVIVPENIVRKFIENK